MFASMAVGEPWVSILKESTLAPLTGWQDILQLRMLKWRIQDEGSEELSGAEAQLVRLSARFVVFGDFFVDQAAAEWRHGIRSDMWNTIETFKLDLYTGLSAAEPQSQEIAKSAAVIRKRVDATGNILALAHADQWHVAWAILTLGWQLAEHLGFSSSTWHVWQDIRLPTLREAIGSRLEFRSSGAVTCPRCHSDAELGSDAAKQKGLASIPWKPPVPTRRETTFSSISVSRGRRIDLTCAEAFPSPIRRSQTRPRDAGRSCAPERRLRRERSEPPPVPRPCGAGRCCSREWRQR